jgi:hypothetical protein
MDYKDYFGKCIYDINRIKLLRHEADQLEKLIWSDIQELEQENPELAKILIDELKGA